MKQNNPGIILAIVTDNQDPDSLGRVKVKIEILGEEILTNWIPVLSMGSSPDTGCYFLPEIESKVIISFIGKGITNPIVLGGIWAEYQQPPITEENSDADLNKDGENNLKFIRSRSGQRIIFDDTDGKEKIQILSSDANTRFEFIVSDEVINIETDKDINLIAGGKLYVEAKEAEFAFSETLEIKTGGIKAETSDGDIEFTSKNGLSIEANSIKLN